jgi:hypothetical protein
MTMPRISGILYPPNAGHGGRFYGGATGISPLPDHSSGNGSAMRVGQVARQKLFELFDERLLAG